ncbi:UTP--glucose-1-phosphate uridylyltransferase GalU [Candidatus Uhrbacteria bacterium]|nr:UTP--glucose-1-phosphate uridylyltransferase GalU [Candidatus Uhrbacteria bacterium]
MTQKSVNPVRDISALRALAVSNGVKKAIIPVAGLGTRFLPATKAQPKEMLPVVDKPVIQYIVEEAVASGIEEIIFVTSMGKRAIEDHFDRNFELEYRLREKKKKKELEEVAKISKLANFSFVRQGAPLGDGHAVLSALPFVDEHEPVAVMFGDDIITSKKPALKELMETYHRYNDPVITVSEVPKKEVSHYGVIDGKKIASNLWEISDFVEKPSPKEAPSNLIFVGRAIITPEMMKVLLAQKPGRDGEIRLANAFETYLKGGRPIYAKLHEGKRYDCGTKLGFLIAQVELGIKHPDVGEQFGEYLKNMPRT